MRPVPLTWQHREEEKGSDADAASDCDRPDVTGTLLEVTRHWGPASGRDQIDASDRSWNLTGSDRTLGSYVRLWHCAMFGHHLTVGIRRSVFEERDDVVAIH